MTLSQETIHSLPVPDFELSPDLVKALRASERTSKVYKQNAGAAQENVKHPMKLIEKLNQIVLPGSADLLIALHQNSDVTPKLLKNNVS